MLETAYIAIIITLAGFLHGLTGFGFGLIALPLLSLLIPIKTIIPLTLILSIFINLTLAVQLKESIHVKTISTLLVTTIPGIPLGIYMLTQFPAETLALLVGVLMVSFTSYQLLAKPVPRKFGTPVTLFAGFTSGILTGATSTGGPPVIIYAAFQPWTKDQAKVTLASYFLICGVVTTIIHAFSGVITADVLYYSAVGFPALIVGMYAGTWTYKHISDHGYRRLAIILVMLLGIMMIIKNI